MKVYVTETVSECCYLSEEDSEKVRKYAKENDCSLEDAVQSCMDSYVRGNEEFYINLWDDCEIVDSSFDNIDEVDDDDFDEDEQLSIKLD